MSSHSRRVSGVRKQDNQSVRGTAAAEGGLLEHPE